MANKQLNLHAEPYTPKNQLPVIMFPAPPPVPVVLTGFTYQHLAVSDLSGFFFYYPQVIPSVTEHSMYDQYGAVSQPIVKYQFSPIKNSYRKKKVFKSGGGFGGGGGGGGGRTTVMIKNIPNQFGRNTLLQFLDAVCENNKLAYDFLYLPIDFITKNNLGYAFVNFTSACAANRFKVGLEGYKWSCIQNYFGNFSSNKVCAIRWADIQGRDKLIRHFEKQTFLRGKSFDWLPVVFTPPRNGSNSPVGKQIKIGSC